MNCIIKTVPSDLLVELKLDSFDIVDDNSCMLAREMNKSILNGRPMPMVSNHFFETNNNKSQLTSKKLLNVEFKQ